MDKSSITLETPQLNGSNVSPPSGVDVVVVGGGIVGASTALFLSENGLRVCLCEKGRIAGEQSSRNWGWVRQMGRDPAEMPLAIESLKTWRSFKSKYGVETGYRETGIVYAARTKREIGNIEVWAETGKTNGLRQEILAPNQIETILPGIAPGFILGLHTASDGRAEPTMATQAIAQVAKNKGTFVLSECAVRGVDLSGGRVSAAVTEKGDIKCSAVVVAGGAWTRLFLGNLGIEFPQLKILGTAARVDNVADVPRMPVGGGDFAFRKRLDGGLTVALRNTNIAPITPDSFRLLPKFLRTYGRTWRQLRLRVGSHFISEFTMPRHWSFDETTPFERVRVLDPDPHKPFNHKALRKLGQAFPAFLTARCTHQWAGLIDVTPDAIPVIDRVCGREGLYVASGFSGHGFGVGPGAGKLMAQILTNESPCVNPAPFRFERFSSPDSSGEAISATGTA